MTYFVASYLCSTNYSRLVSISYEYPSLANLSKHHTLSALHTWKLHKHYFLLAPCASHTSDLCNLCCCQPCYMGTRCTNWVGNFACYITRAYIIYASHSVHFVQRNLEIWKGMNMQLRCAENNSIIHNFCRETTLKTR